MTKVDPTAPGSFTVQAAAERLGLTAGYLNNMRHNRKGPKFYKISNRVYYKAEDLDAWNTVRLGRKSARAAKLREKAEKLSARAAKLSKAA